MGTTNQDEQFDFYVKLIGPGGLLSCEGFESIDEVRYYVATELVPRLEDGDQIIIE